LGTRDLRGSIMKNGIKLGACATFGVAALAFASPAYAQATRTWVSGVGDDVNPCSRTAPCKTFAGAISKTAPGGEINCLDPGGFGTLTITKSITVDCTGTFGSTLNSGGINGFTINDSLSATPGQANVILRGLSINGAGATPGLNGIRFISGKSLVLQDIFIQNQRSGNGISIANSSGAVHFHAEDVTVANGLGGIEIRPTGATAAVNASLDNVRVENNTGNGVRLDTSALTGGTGVRLSVTNSVVSGNNTGISANSPAAGTQFALAMIDHSDISQSAGIGLNATGNLARLIVGNSTISGNGTGVAFSAGGTVNTYSDNRLAGNATDGAFGPAFTPQ
jgi:hypothetical protein